ncbi:MAG: DNA-3-methyladenine glycosylase I [Anaerolineae bacterium]|jgi:3-methyladenine DNA glycosylase Tag
MPERPGFEIPPRVTPADENGYFEQMTKAIFQAGFSWQVVNDKWPNFRQAFDGFDVDPVAAYGLEDVDRLLSDPGIVRNGRKIEATITNAIQFQTIRREFGSFHNYLRSLDDLPYREKQEALSKRFNYLGRTGVFVFLWCVNEEVPDWEDR